MIGEAVQIIAAQEARDRRELGRLWIAEALQRTERLMSLKEFLSPDTPAERSAKLAEQAEAHRELAALAPVAAPVTPR